MKFQLSSPGHYLTDLSLPWSLHLTQWPAQHFVKVAHGIHRNVVKFISHKNRVYALKELSRKVAEHEYSMLKELEERGLPVVEAVGLISDRDKEVPKVSWLEEYFDMSDRALLITEYLRGTLPYRVIIENGIDRYQLNLMLDALADLLVKLHLSGFYWGDCSLSNALFKRDAGLMAAYLVDAETASFVPDMTRHRREYDLELAHTNIAGDLMDLQAAGLLPLNMDPIDLTDFLVERYNTLWDELTRDEVFDTAAQHEVEKRIRRLNDLGYNVEEMEINTLESGKKVKMTVNVVEPWHHRRKLQSLTGLDVQENQAKRLLNDLHQYRARINREYDYHIPREVAAFKWLTEIYQPAIDAIPEDLRGGLDPAELYHELLEHRWYMSERFHHDIGLKEAIRSYIENVLKLRALTTVA
ncbi:DUF4032 domain-containing protein [Gynuella sp.]|uniref:DUF4032 domain-containing protein n=1 Tax=Gynuella sp. TaxID=2969146 RepID=UPI003D120374